jgi:hypothetical protein
VPGAVAEADRVVEPLSGKVDPVVVGRKPKIDEWMRLAEARQARQQPADGERADRADAQHFAHHPAVEPAERLGDPVERLAKHRQQRAALVRQREAARQPAEQGRAEPLLERLYLVAERGRSHAKLDRCIGESSNAGRRLRRSEAH